jgi:TonB family protein
VQLKNNAANYVYVNPAPGSLTAMDGLTQFKNRRTLRKLPVDSLFPEGGWQSFRAYVYKKLHKENEMDTGEAVITGWAKSVEVEFRVDDNGIARDVKITRSLDGESDAKAMELVQQWPRWIATRKDKKGKVVIQF